MILDVIKRCTDLFTLKRKYPQMELMFTEVKLVADCLHRRGPCNFLVFGMGHDSALWMQLNEGGRTVFLEDHDEWYKKITSECPEMEGYLVKYTTTLPEWRDVLEHQERLEIDLPDKITKTSWHVILVDGPKGDPKNHQKYGVHPPGRMQSIYTASSLAAPGGDVFVHDCDRQVESTYAHTYLGRENLRKSVRGRGLLRHYQMP